MNYKLSVGFNGNQELLKKMFSIAGNKIGTIYTGGYFEEISSGRYQYAESKEKLKKAVDFVHNKGVKIAVTLNSPCNVPPKSNKEWWEKVENYLKELEEINVDYVIIAHPFIMKMAKETTNLKIVASVICDINSIRGALYYENMGADIIVPSSSINYDLNLLKSIKNNLKHSKIAILVNEACLGNCPWRRFHQNALSHANKKGYDIDYAKSCTTLYSKEPYMMLTNNVIRPEDLHNYEGISNDFKLVGRTTDEKTIIKMIEAYSNEQYKGNLVEIVDKGFSKIINLPNEKLENLFLQKTKCLKNCQNCSICKSLYEEINK